MNKNIFIPLSLFAVFFSNYLGHVSPPTSILLTPIVIVGIAIAILKVDSIELMTKSIIISSFIILNDLLIRTYAGGTHDSQGNGWIMLMFLIGSLFALIAFMIFASRNEDRISKPWMSFIVSVLLLSSYTIYFGRYGTEWAQFPSDSRQESQQSGIYIKDLLVSGNLKVESAWCEKTIRVNHEQLFKKNYETEELTYVIKLDTSQSKSVIGKGYNFHNGSFKTITEEISFSAHERYTSIDLMLIDESNLYEVVDTIRIKRP